jgi:phosphoserine aminotransferase
MDRVYVVRDTSVGSGRGSTAGEMIFLITMSIKVSEAVKFNLFLTLCVYLFSFILHSHSKTGGVQLVSRRERLKASSSASRHLQDGSKI